MAGQKTHHTPLRGSTGFSPVPFAPIAGASMDYQVSKHGVEVNPHHNILWLWHTSSHIRAQSIKVRTF